MKHGSGRPSQVSACKAPSNNHSHKLPSVLCSTKKPQFFVLQRNHSSLFYKETTLKEDCRVMCTRELTMNVGEHVWVTSARSQHKETASVRLYITTHHSGAQYVILMCEGKILLATCCNSLVDIHTPPSASGCTTTRKGGYMSPSTLRPQTPWWPEPFPSPSHSRLHLPATLLQTPKPASQTLIVDAGLSSPLSALLATQTHQAKVTYLEKGWLSAGDEHVCWLDIPVHNLAGVAEGKCCQHLPEKVARHVLTHCMPSQVA